VEEAGTEPSRPEARGEEPAAAIPLGQGIDGVQLLVLNRAGKLAGVGEIGETVVRTGYLAQGYWRDEALTREKFISNPATALEEDRLYRTGDLGRYLPNGEVVFAGRQDAQVKIRGFRVELGEIEAVLRGHPAIESCAVVVPGRDPNDEVLLAFIVSRDQEALSVKALRPWLEARLPAYMIPARFITIPSLPVTPNGKLDQRALLALDAAPGQTTSEESGPINLLELELIRIWRRLFKHETIGRQDHFFALGGHSLLAVRLAMEIDALLGCKLPIATLFQSPTIESLAQRLTDENWAPPWSALVPLQPNGSRPALFFVHGWGGDVYVYWELAKLLSPEQPSYGIQAAGLDGKSARHITVEAMAAHYVNELVSFQPEGAFYLGGYSLGGKIAYEIAQQLHQRGRRVALLALIDTYPTGHVPWFLCGLPMVARCRFHFKRLWQIPCHEQFDYLKGRWKAFMYWINRNRAKPAPITAVPQPTSENPKVTGFRDYYQAVASVYQFQPYPGTADMLFVDEQALNQWRWYWRYLARGGVSFHPVTGDHNQIMFSPDYRSKLAHTLTAVLHQRQAREQARQANC
jgi:aspartate racemase